MINFTFFFVVRNKILYTIYVALSFGIEGAFNTMTMAHTFSVFGLNSGPDIYAKILIS